MDNKSHKKVIQKKAKIIRKIIFKKRNAFNETAYYTYKSLFEAIISVSLRKILQFKYDIEKKWTVVKEIIGKAKHSEKSNFLQKLKIGNKIG